MHSMLYVTKCYLTVPCFLLNFIGILKLPTQNVWFHHKNFIVTLNVASAQNGLCSSKFVVFIFPEKESILIMILYFPRICLYMELKDLNWRIVALLAARLSHVIRLICIATMWLWQKWIYESAHIYIFFIKYSSRKFQAHLQDRLVKKFGKDWHVDWQKEEGEAYTALYLEACNIPVTV